MKKYLMFVLVALGLVFAASCQDENVVEGNQPKRISIEASKCLDSRTVVAGDGTVTWSSGDRLLVFGDNISGILTLEKNDVGKPIGTFTGFVDGDPTKLKHAVYGNSSFWNNQVSLQYNKYIYPNSNSPMVGDIANGNVNLEHLFGMVRLQIINMPKTESELIIKGSGIGGTLHWNGNFFEMEYSEDEIKITIPAGKRNGMMTVDVPVYVSKSSDNLTVSLNGVPYKKAGETKQETAVKTTLKTGALNVTSMPKMEWTADGRLTESTGWGEDVEGEDKLESESDGSYLIMDAEDLARFASEVNAGNKFEGKTVKLGKDIDLMDKEWTPIGTSSEKTFHGTFDGQNHIISNLTINGEGKSDQGLFGMTKNGEIKNLTVNNAKVSGRLNVGVVAGTPYTSKYTNIKVTGHVEVNGFAYVGAVGGKNAYANWENITVNVDETSYVNANSVENGLAYRTYVGGVVGFNGEGGHSFKNITSNIDVKGSTCDVGGLFGIAHYGNKFENCVCTGDVEIYAAAEAEEAEEVGGIAGVWHNNNGTTVTFTNCSFTGEVITNFERGTVWYNNLVGKPYSSKGKGKLIIDGKSFTFANSMDNLNDALAGGNSNIALGGGTFTMPTTTGDVTISGTTETVITIDKPQAQNVTLSGVTVQGSGNYTGIQHSEKVVYENCVVKGTQFLYANEVLIKDCTVDLTEVADYIWTYGAKNVVFDNCIFNTKGKAILVYNEGAGATNVTVKDCTFNASASAKAGAIANQNCAAIEIDNYQDGGIGTAHVVTTEGNVYSNNFSGEWRIKSYTSGNPITVNNKEYTSIAIDGKLMTIDAGKNVTVLD